MLNSDPRITGKNDRNSKKKGLKSLMKDVGREKTPKEIAKW